MEYCLGRQQELNSLFLGITKYCHSAHLGNKHKQTHTHTHRVKKVESQHVTRCTLYGGAFLADVTLSLACYGDRLWSSAQAKCDFLLVIMELNDLLSGDQVGTTFTNCILKKCYCIKTFCSFARHFWNQVSECFQIDILSMVYIVLLTPR